MYAPEIGDFVYITDNAYSKTKIRSMEQKMLKACDFDFSNPLCLHFLRRNSKAGSVCSVCQNKYRVISCNVRMHIAKEESYTSCSKSNIKF